MAFREHSSEPVSSSVSDCPTIHVELCQKPTRCGHIGISNHSTIMTNCVCHSPIPFSSTLSPSLLRESAVATLERRGSTFGDLTLTQFDDPLLTEHALYLAVVDIPKHVSVQQKLASYLPPSLPLSFPPPSLYSHSTLSTDGRVSVSKTNDSCVPAPRGWTSGRGTRHQL